MQYRRAKLQGGSFFFTLVTYNRQRIFISDEAVDNLRAAFRKVFKDHPFNLDAIVILPEHIHCIWTLPSGDADFSGRWRLIKSYFSRKMSVAHPFTLSRSREAKHEKAVWQRRYWEHMIRDEIDYIRHVEYIHYNPVKHGLVKSPVDWTYSSFHRFVEKGLYDSRWGSGNQIVFDYNIGME